MTLQEILNAHRQIYPNSCPSSVMELVAKLHGRMKPDETPFQDKYQNGPVGFEKLFELDQLRFVTKQHHMPFSDAWPLCEKENGAGRYPLVSLPTESTKSFLDGQERLGANRHMFITLLNPSLTLFFHYFGGIGPNLATPADIQRQVLRFDATYQVNLTTYTLLP